MIGGIALAAGLVVCGAGWVFVPALQGGKGAVAAQASTELERARRLLQQYDPGLAYKSLIVGQFADDGIEVDADDLSENVQTDYEEIHGSLWDAYQPQNRRGDSETAARADYGDIAGQIRSGLSAQAQLAGDNERLLADAMRAVEVALSVTSGGEDARSNAEANRLKAVIQYHQGLAKWSQAQQLRREADDYRRELAALATEAAGAAANSTLVADTGIDEELAKLEARVGETEAAVDVSRQALGALDTRIGDLEARLSAAQGRLELARKEVDRLRENGVDFSDPNGSENFRKEMEEQSSLLRKEMRDVHTLQHGDYSNANIDRSGDYLAGNYVVNGGTDNLTVQFGLEHYRNERAVLAATVERRNQEIADLRSDVGLMQETKERYRSAEVAAAEQIAATSKLAAEVYDDVDRSDSEAFAVEDEALELLDKAARTAKQASRFADDWIGDARERAERSPAFAKRLTDTWMGGHIAAQEADARLIAAWIGYDRFTAYTENARILRSASGLEIKESDPETEDAKANDARTAAVEQITEAVEVLKNAHRKLNNHWTLTAQAAGANDLMALFGYEDYLADAIESYRSAVKGRESDRTAQPFVDRLSRLEGR